MTKTGPWLKEVVWKDIQKAVWVLLCRMGICVIMKRWMPQRWLHAFGGMQKQNCILTHYLAHDTAPSVPIRSCDILSAGLTRIVMKAEWVTQLSFAWLQKSSPEVQSGCQSPVWPLVSEAEGRKTMRDSGNCKAGKWQFWELWLSFIIVCSPQLLYVMHHYRGILLQTLGYLEKISKISICMESYV